jgi:cytochrome b involved in lipid metabolism/succinate dehydrogenase/fumarate reductase flavoprotein subunit
MDAKERVVIIGGGLAGLTTACECLEKGIPVVILEKMGRLGGNSARASGGIAAPGSKIQKALGVPNDNMQDLLAFGGTSNVKEFLEKAGQDVDWLLGQLGIAEELVLYKTPGHKVARTLGVSKGLPGQLITCTCSLMLEKIAQARHDLLKIICNCTVKKLVTEGLMGRKVVGVEYSTSDGSTGTIKGPVVVATGGFASSANSFIKKHGAALLKHGSTNDERTDGSGIVLAQGVGATTEDMENITLFPNCFTIDQEFKVVASDVLLSAGAVVLQGDGKPCGDSMAPMSQRVASMTGGPGPHYLVISQTKAQDANCDVSWFVEMYAGKGLMKQYVSARAFAAEKGLQPSYFESLVGSGSVIAGEVSPALYSCAGGLKCDGAQVLNRSGTPIEGLFAAGEVTSSPFKQLWAVSGIPLMQCVYSGRLAAERVAKHMTPGTLTGFQTIYVSIFAKQAALADNDTAAPTEKPLDELSKEELIEKLKGLQAGGAVAAAPAGPAGISEEELAKHNTREDPWVCINGEVYDVSKWIPIHPGGVQAIEAYLGKDASDEWNTIHTKPGILKANMQHLTVKGKLGAGGAPAAAGGAAPAASGFADMAEVAKHNKQDDAWIVLDGMVVDVTRFIPVHPGGVAILMSMVGTDVSDEWHGIHGADLSKFRAQEKGAQGPIVKGNVIGGAAPAAAAGGGDEDAGPTPDSEYGGIAIPVIGPLIFLVKAVLVMILKTVFFTGNFVFKLDNNRNGTIRSAIFLLFFTIIHVSGNFWDFFNGPNEANGEDYFFSRVRFTGIHLGQNVKDNSMQFNFVPGPKNPLYMVDASIIEVYLLLAGMVHVSVALKRSWDISINYCLHSGRWDMMLSGLVVLTFMAKHLADFRFYEGYKYTVIRPAPFGVSPANFLVGHNPLAILDGNLWTDPEAEPVVVTNLYKRMHELFGDVPTLIFYVTSVSVFMIHMCKGWAKCITADVMMIPVKHRTVVKYMGWILAICIGSMYITVAIGTHFETPENLFVCDGPNVKATDCYCPVEPCVKW